MTAGLQIPSASQRCSRMAHTTGLLQRTDIGSLGNDRPEQRGEQVAFYMRKGWKCRKLCLGTGNKSDGTLQLSISVQTNMDSTVMGVHHRPFNHEKVDHGGILCIWKKPRVCRLQSSRQNLTIQATAGRSSTSNTGGLWSTLETAS